ncbi:TIGR02186 family protein [Chachezhania antarctica]|uniref:TIGR02186 family protein n=1 Tax=Chachezhania antarctica TaxID=2340860 RepID=UPI000EAEEFFC|nr:TIGR02186 family protein [Chachezhania antarctica]|tara:strand:+ start:5135 stop:5914 length:780 start_codon:yes stop_codon:yes gene_type:complete
MIARALLGLVVALWSGAALAQEEPLEEVVLGLSRDRVAITTQFDGSEILVFGAVKREAPMPPDPPLEVIVTVSGPSAPVLVRKKARRFGIWVNTQAVLVDAAPSFYAVATTAPLDEILSETEDLRWKISIDRAIRSVGAPSEITEAARFTEALIRIREEKDLYQMREGKVALDQSTLFRTALAMPSDLTEGAYDIRIFLTRGRDVVSSYTTVIDVNKVGLERFLFDLSRAQPLVYGLMSLAIAIAAGWGASAAFRLLRR